LQIGLVRQATAQSRISSNLTPKGEPSTILQKAHSHPEGHFPPSQIGKAHTHATVSNGQREKLKGATRIASLSSHKTPPAAPSETTLSLSFFKSVNPILLASGNMGLAPEKKPTTHAKKAMEPPIPSPLPTRPLIRNKIQTNPYVNDSVNEKWTDPQTQLVYHTDLCHYLGHNRRDAGRHTLTGVGQYMKTVFNIKVRYCLPCRSQGRCIARIGKRLFLNYLQWNSRYMASHFTFPRETCSPIQSWNNTLARTPRNFVRMPISSKRFVL